MLPRYLQQLTGVETMTSLRQSIRQDLDNQLLLAQQLREKMSDLMDRAERFQHLNPFNPFEITVEVGSICEGKTLADVNFWQNTMATVIAISHNGELLISPGPHNRMQAGDIVYFVGDENAPAGWTGSCGAEDSGAVPLREGRDLGYNIITAVQLLYLIAGRSAGAARGSVRMVDYIL